MGADFNAKELFATFTKLETTAKSINTSPEFAAWAERVVATAKSFAPVKTGKLRGSINFKADETGVTIFAGTEYASYVEYGTVKMNAQPFFNPAIEAHLKELETFLGRALIKRIN